MEIIMYMLKEKESDYRNLRNHKEEYTAFEKAEDAIKYMHICRDKYLKEHKKEWASIEVYKENEDRFVVIHCKDEKGVVQKCYNSSIRQVYLVKNIEEVK